MFVLASINKGNIGGNNDVAAANIGMDAARTVTASKTKAIET